MVEECRLNPFEKESGVLFSFGRFDHDRREGFTRIEIHVEDKMR